MFSKYAFFLFVLCLAGLPVRAADNVEDLNARLTKLEQQLAAPASTSQTSKSYMNLSLDVVGSAGWASTEDFERIQPGGHDPVQNGFSLRNAELAMDGAVDPYFKGAANVVLIMEPDEETSVELEEAYALSTSLPDGLQVKAGRFFAEFGRQNNQHPHAWMTVDQPLVMNRLLGEDGMRQNGARLSWLLPTPAYAEVLLGVFNGQGGTASSFRNLGEEGDDGVTRVYGHATTDRSLDNPGDLLYVPRAVASFELTDQQTLVLGASGAFGPNDTGENCDTRIYGADAFWKWKSAHAEAGWPFVTWHTEVMARDFEAGEDLADGLAAETLHDWGAFSQVQWGFVRRWVGGLRGEYVTGDDSLSEEATADRGDETRVSPNITWFPSEFSKLRLQYNHTWFEEETDEDAVWLQFEFLLGAHAAHKF